MKVDKNTIPRRFRVDLFTPVEKMIYECQGEVEKMGADVRLTDALNLLIEARHKIAEFVDDLPPSEEKKEELTYDKEPHDLRKRIIDLLNSEQRLAAVKEHFNYYQVSLRESKLAVDKIWYELKAGKI